MKPVRVFDQGYTAFQVGGDNPYRPGTNKAKEWQHGFDSAYIAQQKRLNCYVPGPRIPNYVPSLKQMVANLRTLGFMAAAAHIEKHGLHR